MENSELWKVPGKAEGLELANDAGARGTVGLVEVVGKAKMADNLKISEQS